MFPIYFILHSHTNQIGMDVVHNVYYAYDLVIVNISQHGPEEGLRKCNSLYWSLYESMPSL